MKKLLFFLAYCFLGSFCLAQKYDLRLNLRKGERYFQNLVSNITIDQRVGNQSVKANTIMSFKIAYKVKDIMDSVYILETSFEKLSMKIILPNGSQDYSSEKKDNRDRISSILATMKSKPFYLKITDKGKVRSVSNMDSLFSDPFTKLPKVSEEENQNVQSQLTRNVGKYPFAEYLEIFPDFPIGKGEKWTIITEEKGEKKSRKESDFKLKDMTDDYYIITGESKTKESDNKTLQIIGIPADADIRMTGKMTSEITINKTSGWINQAKINQSYQGSTLVKRRANMKEDMVIPVWMKNVITINEE